MNKAGRIGFVIRGDYSDIETYDFLDVVYYNGASYVAKKLTTGNTPQRDDEYWHILANANNISDETPTFDESTARANINSGEKISTLFGKIKKWYTDLKNVAFSGSYNDLSDTPSIPSAVAVKGDAEDNYRTGDVNLTPANIGAVPTSNVLDSMESITANTASGNVAGALGTKEINANLQSQIDTLNSNLNKGFINTGTSFNDLVIPSKTWTKVSRGNIKLSSDHIYLVITSISISCKAISSNLAVTIRSTFDTNTRQTVMTSEGLTISATLTEIINNTDTDDYGIEIYSVVEITGITIVHKAIQLI